MNKRLSIEGMSCHHCSNRVEKALKVMEGISEVRVNLEEGYAEIEDTIGIKDEELVSVVDEAGYKLETIINI